MLEVTLKTEAFFLIGVRDIYLYDSFLLSLSLLEHLLPRGYEGDCAGHI